MGKWIKVTAQYDHRWPSRAMTSYPPGIHFVKNEVAVAAIARGRAEETERPESEAARDAEADALRVQAAVDAAAEAAAAESANRAAVAAEEAKAKRQPKSKRVEVKD